MAWNSIVKQRLQLQVTNQRGVSTLKTVPVHQHGSSSPNTGAYSNSMLQGRSFRDSRNLSEKNARKSFTAKKALLIACGVRCVLSPRPSNCSTSSPHKDNKDRAHSTSARGQKYSADCVEIQGELKVWDAYTVIKRTGERERARSSIHRQRVPLDSSHRPSTVPLENQMGRRALSTPETPMCKILWRRKDDQNVLQDRPQHLNEEESPNLTPLLHLYLPSSYQLQEQREDTALGQNNSSEVHEKQDITEELREHDITMESQKQDITVNKTADEGQNDFTEGIRYDITDTWQHDIQKDTPEETFENDMTEERRPQYVTDDKTQHEIIENQCDIDRSFNTLEDKQECDITEKAMRTKSNRSSYRASDAKLIVKPRCPATATALTFPSTMTDRNPSPTLSILPSFYGTSFGYRIRTTSEPCRSKTRTRKACDDDSRFTQAMNDMRHTIEIKGNPCLLQTRAGVAVSPHPKIMSIKRGSQPRKIKTTKTFLWGPEGPQETKTECELYSPVNRWRSLD